MFFTSRWSTVVRKVWERLGTRMRLAVDGNRALTTRDTLRLSRECQDVPFILEQPCNTIDEIRSIRAQLHHAGKGGSRFAARATDILRS